MLNEKWSVFPFAFFFIFAQQFPETENIREN